MTVRRPNFPASEQGERNIATRLGTYQRTVVAQCAEIPTPEQYADVLRYRDLDLIKAEKAAQFVLVDDTSEPGIVTQIEGFVRMDWQVGHHWPPKYVQDRFIEMGVNISDKDDAPVQICVEFSHGHGGSSSSIHNLMRFGAFPEDAAELRARYDTPQELMDELIRFVKNSTDDQVRPFAKPLRAWAVEHGVPFSE